MKNRITRRRAMTLGCGAVAAAMSSCCLGSAYATVAEPHWLQITGTEVHVQSLPPALDGLRVVHLTDLHLGPYVGVSHLRRAVSRANRLDGDLVVVTGDFVTQSAGYAEACARELAALRARYGVFAVLGNHDVWTDGDRVAAEVRDAGVRVLRDQRVLVEADRARLWLIGIEDAGYTGGSFDTFRARWAGAARALQALLRGIPPGEPRLLLVHNPDFTEVVPAGEVGLALSGHTHGGQVRLPWVGPPVVPSCFGAKYAGGLVQGPGTLVYVSRGVGLIAPPVRLGCRPEVALLRLRAV